MPERTTKTAALTVLLLAALAAAGCGEDAEARRAFEAGRFEEADAAFAALVAAAGEEASGRLLADASLAALRAGKEGDADSFAAKALARGGEEVRARTLLVRGAVAYGRCETAAVQALAVEAEPFAFDVAIAYGEKAKELWAAAAATRADWPLARRDVERAIVKLDEVREQKAKAARERARKAAPLPTPKPLPPPDGEGTSTEEKEAKAMHAELTPDQVRALFERLREKEREKRELRRSRREAGSAGVERDW